MKIENDNIVAVKSYNFALRVIKLYKYLISDKKEFVLSKQILRSGTSIGALVKESKLTILTFSIFHFPLSIFNCGSWLMLLKDSDFIDLKSYDSIHPDIEELIKLLASIVKTTKVNLQS